MKEVFAHKKTHNAVTSALQRANKDPLQESCVLLVIVPEVLDVPPM